MITIIETFNSFFGFSSFKGLFHVRSTYPSND